MLVAEGAVAAGVERAVGVAAVVVLVVVVVVVVVAVDIAVVIVRDKSEADKSFPGMKTKGQEKEGGRKEGKKNEKKKKKHSGEENPRSLKRVVLLFCGGQSVSQLCRPSIYRAEPKPFSLLVVPVAQDKRKKKTKQLQRSYYKAHTAFPRLTRDVWVSNRKIWLATKI